MVDVSEINDRLKLRQWLEDKPRDWSVWVAHRAAIRVAPLGWGRFRSDRARERNLTELPLLRGLLISGVAAVRSTPVIRDAATSAFASADAAFAATDDGYAADAAMAAAYASQASAFGSPATASAALAASASVSAVAYLVAPQHIWEAVRSDCDRLPKEGGGPLVPLWSDGLGPFQGAWRDLKRSLPNTSAGHRDETARAPLSEDWSFWIRWYDAALEGRPLNLDMLEEIALIPPKIWEQGPGVVNPLIADIEAKYLRLGTWNAERIVENSETHRLRVEPSSVLAPGSLQDVQEKMRGAAEAFEGEGGANGPYGALASEVEMVRRAAGRNDPRPIYLYDTCRRALRRAAGKAQKGDCPEDAPLEDFISQLDEASSDLRTFNADVERVAASRAEKKFAEAGEGARDVLLAGAQKVAEVSEGDLAEEMPEDAIVAIDPEASAEERKVALYRLASRLTRVWAGAKKVAKQVGEETDDIAKMSKNTATIIVSSGAVLAAINYLIALF